MNQWLPLSNEDAKASYLKKLSWACNKAKPMEPSAYSKMLSSNWRLVLMVLWEMVMQFSTFPSFIIQSEFNKNLLSASMYGHSASHFQYKKTLAPELRDSQLGGGGVGELEALPLLLHFSLCCPSSEACFWWLFLGWPSPSAWDSLFLNSPYWCS